MARSVLAKHVPLGQDGISWRGSSGHCWERI